MSGWLPTGGGVTDTWQTWSATLKGSVSDPSVGNGTEEAFYIQLGTGSGSLVICRYYLEFGSTTTDGSGVWRLDGPVTAKSYDPGSGAFGSVQAYDSDVTEYFHGAVRYLGGAQEFDFPVDNGTASVQVDGDGNPFTWATGDRFSAQWSYEVA